MSRLSLDQNIINPRLRVWRYLSALLIGSLLWASGPAPLVVLGQGYTIEECDRIDERTLRTELESIMAGMLATESELFDIASIVERQWQELDVGVVLAQEVDVAIAQVRSDTTYWERVLSGWAPAQAEAMADSVATATLSSAPLQAKLGELANAVALELAHEVEALTAQSASAGLLCLQSYIGAQFSQELYTLFEQSIEAEASALTLVATDVVSLSPLADHGKALGGVGTILVATVSRQLVQALGQRLAGRLAGRITGRLLGRLGSSAVPVVGWLIGAGLIVWDLVEGNDGALPQIREMLTSAEVQATLRQEIARVVRDELAVELQISATFLAATMVDEWQRFCEEFATVCGLAAANQQFNQVLAQTRVEELPALAVWLQAIVEWGGSDGVERLAEQGILEDLIVLPEAAVAILRYTGSPDIVLAWSKLAGSNLPWVVEQQFYTLVTPAEVTPELFAKFVTIGNNEVLEKLLTLESSDLEPLLLLPTAQLESIAADASVSDLTWLSGYLAQVGAAEAGYTAEQLADGAVSVATLRTQIAAADAVADTTVVVRGEAEQTSAGAPVQRLVEAEDPLFVSPVLLASVLLLLVLIGWGALVAIWRTRRVL